MDSFRETRRQMLTALGGMILIFLIGVVGLMIIEGDSLMDAVWITVTTLTTIGYGDVVARTTPARIFTLLIIIAGIGVYAYGLQALASFFLSPEVRRLRRQRVEQRKIDRLSNHYIICGNGDEMVDETIKYLLHKAAQRRRLQLDAFYRPLDRFLDGIFGDDAHGHFPKTREVIRQIFVGVANIFYRSRSLLDVVVVITEDLEFAEELHDQGLLVIEGKSNDDDLQIRAGVQRALAMMVMLHNDTEALLTVLTARSHNPSLFITAAALDEDLSEKIARVGANSVIAPFEVAGQALNSATLRPVVFDFYNTFLFSNYDLHETTQLYIHREAHWLGMSLRDLRLKDTYRADIIGVHHAEGRFTYVPDIDYTLEEGDTLITVAPGRYIPKLQHASRMGVRSGASSRFEPKTHFHNTHDAPAARTYSLIEAEEAAQSMSNHYVICGAGRLIRNAVEKLNPERPFVIVSNDGQFVTELIHRGFRVVHGNPMQEEVLLKARIDRALAIMISIENDADSILTVLSSRSISDNLLISVTANSDEMVNKLHRAGADRVAGAFTIAAQFTILATTRPAISSFFQHVLFNYHEQIETTELYMEDNSAWIDKSIGELKLRELFDAAVIGVRLASGGYLYAPSYDHVIAKQEVLIVVTPMQHSDHLREMAHGSESKRPNTLRSTSTVEVRAART